MVDFIMMILGYMFKSVSDLSQGKGLISGITSMLSPENFNSTVYNLVINLQEHGVMPIANVILGLSILLSIYEITVRNDLGQGMAGVEIPFKVMFKAAICKIVLDNTNLILNALYSIAEEVSKGISNVSNTMGINIEMESIRKVIDDAGYSTQLMICIIVIIILICVVIVNVMVTVIIYARMVELYIHIAIAPILIATLANGELKTMGVNFLKNFFAVCIQGAFIILSIVIVGTFMGSMTKNIDSSFIGLVEFMGLLLCNNILLLMAIFQTGKWSKSICNAM